MPPPSGRTYDYQIWRICERWQMKPPGVSASWDECPPLAKAQLIAYEQLREYEEYESRSVKCPMT